MTTESLGPSTSGDGPRDTIAMLSAELMALTEIVAGTAVMLGTLTEIGQALHSYSSEMAPLVQPMLRGERGDDSFVWQMSHHGRHETRVSPPHVVRHAAASAGGLDQVRDRRRVEKQPEPAAFRPGSATVTLPIRVPARSQDSRPGSTAPEVAPPIQNAVISQVSSAGLSEVMASMVAPYPVSPQPQQAVTAEQWPQKISVSASQTPLAPGPPADDDDTFASRPQPIVVLQTPPPGSLDERDAILSPASVPPEPRAEESWHSPRPSAGESTRLPATSGASGSIPGTIYIEGSQLGRWVVDYLSRQAARPATGITGIDPRITPTFPGAPSGA